MLRLMGVFFYFYFSCIFYLSFLYNFWLAVFFIHDVLFLVFLFLLYQATNFTNNFWLWALGCGLTQPGLHCSMAESQSKLYCYYQPYYLFFPDFFSWSFYCQMQSARIGWYDRPCVIYKVSLTKQQRLEWPAMGCNGLQWVSLQPHR